MGHDDKRHRRWQRLGLATVIVATTGLALVWVFLVPIFQSPDELHHFDYALAINAHRGLFQARNAKYTDFKNLIHPYTYHLVERAHTNRVAFHPEQKVPPDYGTRAFYRAIDRDAPAWNTTPTDVPNALVTVYPFGYYAFLAVWIEGLRLIREKPV